MSRIRAIRNRARRDLHREAQVPALYIETTGAEPVPVTVRVHTSVVRIGEVPGYDSVEHRDISPRVIFLRDEVERPKRNAIVTIDATEGWRIADTEQPDGDFITASATRLSAADMVGLPVPEAA